MSDDEKLAYKFERPGFDPFHYTLQMRSDQPAQPLDRAVAFLDAAVEELKEEIRLWKQGGERRETLANLQAKVMEIRKCVVSMPAP